MALTFTPLHRGGSGPPLVCLHGFADTWRTWELVLPALERRHDVLALTLPGHAGGPPVDDPVTATAVADVVEAAMDEAGFATAHLVGNSMGGYLALLLATRDRADSVVAFAPAGGWAAADTSFRDTLAAQEEMLAWARAAAPQADAIIRAPGGRRRATSQITVAYEHIPAELLVHLLCGIASCRGGPAMLAGAREHGWPLDPSLVRCPIRMVWGTADRLLPWPAAAERYRRDWFPHADWVVLDDVGHAPQLDVPAVAASLVLDFTAAPGP